MHILLTSAASPLAQSLAEQLAPAHSLRLTERKMMTSTHEFVLADLGHDASTNLLVRGMDAVIHTDTLPADTDTGAQIDQSTRCTYNLLLAAAAEGVKRVIYLSSLELMAAYAGFAYDPKWRPQPTTTPPTLTKFLGESTCKEFARENKVSVTVLRLAAGASAQQIVDALNAALTSDGPVWQIVHVG
jgi:nucleoside-diphosphate-sugar epimerase